MVELGDRLRQFRKERNLTQKQLASLIGVKNSVISFYEVGERMPSLEVVVRLSRALHISTDTLLGVDKSDVINVSGLSANDKQLIQALIDRLKNK